MAGGAGFAAIRPLGEAQRDANPDPLTFTGHPSLVGAIVALAAQWGGAVADFLHVDIVRTLTPLIASDRPPWFTRIGLDVEYTTFDGVPVWTFNSPKPSGTTVVAVHGGAYIVDPIVFQWLNYAALARSTGVTVVVPLYPLAPQGTAATVVPVIEALLSEEVNRHGTEKVAVYGDSAGGGLALAAMQQLVLHGNPTPARMVLLSPWLDVTMTDPQLAQVNDPFLRIDSLRQAGLEWAGSLSPANPLASPLNGSLHGLPPVTVYSGSLDLLSVDALRLREQALAQGAPFTFVLRRGELHDWPILPLPESFVVRRAIFAELAGGRDPQHTSLRMRRD